MAAASSVLNKEADDQHAFIRQEPQGLPATPEGLKQQAHGRRIRMPAPRPLLDSLGYDVT